MTKTLIIDASNAKTRNKRIHGNFKSNGVLIRDAKLSAQKAKEPVMGRLGLTRIDVSKKVTSI